MDNVEHTGEWASDPSTVVQWRRETWARKWRERGDDAGVAEALAQVMVAALRRRDEYIPLTADQLRAAARRFRANTARGAAAWPLVERVP